MKLFAINETEWIAATTEEEAIKFSGLENDEIYNIEEIPESDWDTEIEVYEDEDAMFENRTVFKPIRELIRPALELGNPIKIMTEYD